MSAYDWWTCTTCGAKNGQAFTRCWKCYRDRTEDADHGKAEEG
jgi:hypothetical protein